MNLKEAVAVLKKGGVVVFPTETSYGLGCDATNAKAVRRVFAIKGRPEGKGTPLIVDSLSRAEHWGVFSSTAKKLAKKFWPGPLTMVVPVGAGLRARSIARMVLQNRTVALRVSSHSIARALAKGLGRPLVATSANLSNQLACYSIRAFEKQIGHSLGLIRSIGPIAAVNVGVLPKRKPTTLVRVVGDCVEVLRRGKIKL